MLTVMPFFVRAEINASRARPLRGHGDEPHDAFQPAGVALPVFLVGIHKILLQLGPRLGLRQKRRFHVSAQHDGSVGLGPLHDGLHAREGPNRVLRAGAHGGGQERRHTHLFQFPAHVADGFLALHGVHALEGVDMNVHKAGQQQVAAQIKQFFALRRQPGADGADPAVPDQKVGLFLKFSVDKGFRVLNQHGEPSFRIAAVTAA